MIQRTWLLVLLCLGAAAAPAQGQADHWAFQPVRRPAVPLVSASVRNDVDRFILAALEAQRRTLSQEADRLTLLRRVCFDLTGLPPTLAEIDAFLADAASGAYERMVERYLASPHYGERWGKHWLDTVGYADSNGYFNADSDRPHAWRYRDYVVRSFNADKPYDRFVMEQLAGDELAGYVPDGDIAPVQVDLLTATHFLRNAPDGTGESDGNPDEVRVDRYTVLEGTLQITMNALAGLTIQCARCHRHKFEPISHADYYRLQAIFFPACNPERWRTPKERIVAVGTRAERAEHQRHTEIIERQVQALDAGLTAFTQSLREQVLDERLRQLPAAERTQVIQAALTPDKKRSKEQQALVRAHATAVTLSDDELARRFPELAKLREETARAKAAREKDRPAPLPKLSVFVEADPNPPVHHILRRGQHNQPGDEVEPGVPAVLLPASYRIEPCPAPAVSTGRRLALAKWLTAADHPLFARVMVNRIWQHHFGSGLVTTVDNLGQSGARPSHPELLDWLASELVAAGWSIKALHRLILSSAVYRQSSVSTGSTFDPDNRLLSHFPLRRLDAEALRDAMLSVGGAVDLRLGGPYVPTKRSADGIVEADDGAGRARRRSIYLQQRRTQVETFLQLFDAPSIASTCSVRTTSTVPLQALAMLNSDFARRCARSFAERVQRETSSADQRVGLAFRLACGRLPRDDEARAAERFVAEQATIYGGRDEPRVWIDFCQMILASNAFVYVP